MDIFALNLMGGPATSPGPRPPGEVPAGFAEALLAALGPPGPTPAPPPPAVGAPQGAVPNEPNALGAALDLLATVTGTPKTTLSLDLGLADSTPRPETDAPNGGATPPVITTQSALTALLGALGVEVPVAPTTTPVALDLAADRIAQDPALPTPVRHLAATVLNQFALGKPLTAEALRPEIDVLVGHVLFGGGKAPSLTFQTDLHRQTSPVPAPIATNEALVALRPDWIGSRRPLPAGPLPQGWNLRADHAMVPPPLGSVPVRGFTPPLSGTIPVPGATPPPLPTPVRGTNPSPTRVPSPLEPPAVAGPRSKPMPDFGVSPGPIPVPPSAAVPTPLPSAVPNPDGTLTPVAPDTVRLTPKLVPSPVDPPKGGSVGPVPDGPTGPVAKHGDPVKAVTILDPVAETVKRTPIWESAIEGPEIKVSFEPGTKADFAVIGGKAEPVSTPAPKVMTVDEFRPVRDALARQIQELAAANRPGSMTLRLNPEALGTITVTVRTLGKSVEADVQASHDSVRQSLHAHRTDLVQAVESRGLSMSAFTVGQDAGQSAYQGQGQNPQQNPTPGSGHAAPARPMIAANDQSAAPTFGLGPAQSLNVVA